ncbi:uncharacterized protein LOC142571884 [Dermacentor variabilis]|uniref:uncharacterized protein LOC142571884 n=1 Tax=Dermacentor variabilis TaxID=34621 RepID=UPI003F5C69FD
MTHIGGSETRVRCLVEGEEVLNAGHIVCCGLKECTVSSYTVQGLCLQTSQVRQKPHELWFEFRSDETIKGHCSCKAGNSKCCKHMVAMLLFTHRTGVQNLDLLTCTDVKQAWGKLKGKNIYKPRKIKDLCHVQHTSRTRLDQQKLNAIRQRLIAAAPQSALARHVMGRCLQSEDGEVSAMNVRCENAGCEPDLIVQHILTSQHAQKFEELLFHEVVFRDWDKLRIYRANMNHLSARLAKFYKDMVAVSSPQAVRICAETAGQNNTRWQRERMLRITGSKCHTLYRFVPSPTNSWQNKIEKLLMQNFQGNDATRYGKACEKPALEEYALKTGNAVSTVGLVVNPIVPWLGFSPDGIVFRHGKPAMLLEIKSPTRGKTESIAQLVKQKKLPYIVSQGENYTLRPTHSYYTQVQLGLFLLHLTQVDLIVYSEVESLVIHVKKCVSFIDSLIQRLQYVYFTHYLPALFKYVQ